MRVLKIMFWLMVSVLCLLCAFILYAGMVLFVIEALRFAVLTHNYIIVLLVFCLSLPIAGSSLMVYELHEWVQMRITDKLIRTQKEEL